MVTPSHQGVTVENDAMIEGERKMLAAEKKEAQKTLHEIEDKEQVLDEHNIEHEMLKQEDSHNNEAEKEGGPSEMIEATRLFVARRAADLNARLRARMQVSTPVRSVRSVRYAPASTPVRVSAPVYTVPYTVSPYTTGAPTYRRY